VVEAKGGAADVMVRAALLYAEKYGFSVIPCRARGKEPLTEHGLKEASKDPAAIRAWWKRWPQANVGIATGATSGIVVLDVDAKAEGPQTLAILEEEHGRLIDTPTVLTGGGGQHVYFRDPRALRNSAGALGLGLDVRADGGYVIAPPSIHPNGRKYDWEVSLRIGELAFADVPPWLLERMKSTAATRFEMPAKVAEGRRNETLFRIGRSLRARGLFEAEILATLKTVNKTRCNPPMPEREIEAIARNAATEPDRPEFAPPHTTNARRDEVVDVTAADDWPEPEELGADLVSVPSLKEELIPPVLRPWILDRAEVFQCPPDYFATAAIVAAGSLIGRKVAIRPKEHDDWFEHANLWGALVAPPGFMKSPVMREAFHPLYRLEAKARVEYEDAKRESEIAKAIADAARHRIQKELREKKLDESAREKLAVQLREIELTDAVCRRYIVNDVTVEKVGELLKENPEGLVLLCDELSGWMGLMEHPEYVNARAFYLTAWSGKTAYTYDRIGRGSLFVEAACLSVFGALVPGTLEQYLRATFSGERADGFIQRFQLIVYPDVPPNWEYVDRPIDQAARDRAFRGLMQLGLMTASGFHALEEPDEIPFVRFTPAAQGIWKEAYEWSMNLARAPDEHSALRSHFSKYSKLIAALALIFYSFRLVDGADSTSIEVDDIVRAWEWARYLESHARRIYQFVISVNETAARVIAEKLRKQRLASPFSVRDIQRKQWTGLRSKEDVEAGLAVLEECAWVRAEAPPAGKTGRPPSARYWINPRVWRPGN
jgi:hypothetical protein